MGEFISQIVYSVSWRKILESETKRDRDKGKSNFLFSHGEGQWLLRGVEVGQGKIPLRLANINACQGLRRK